MNNKTKDNVIQASVLVMIVMFGSKILGFVRQMAIAGVYGSNINTDIYFVSSDFMIGIAGAFTAALTTALVSHYIKLKVQKGQQIADTLASRVLVAFVSFSVLLCLGMIAGAPWIAKLLAPEYTAVQSAGLARYLRFFSVAFVFSAVQAILAAILNANDSFVPGKLYGLLLNPIAIALMFALPRRYGTDVLIVAFVVANVLQLFVLGAFCRRKFKFKLSSSIWDSEVKTVLLLALPLLLANVLTQCNNVVDKIICNLLGEGVASAYSYAYTLEQFVTAILTATVSLVLYSKFSSYAAQKDTQNMQRSFTRSLKCLTTILVPIALIVIFGGRDIVGIVYLRGQFTEENARITQWALTGFAVGLPIVALREMYVKAHFAYENTRRPMIVGLFGVVLNGAMSVAFAFGFEKYTQIPGVFGVSLATSLSALLPIVLLHRSVKTYLPAFSMRGEHRFALQIAAAGAVCGVVTFLLHRLYLGFLPRFAIEAVGGLVSYAVVLWLCKNEEIEILITGAKKRLKVIFG